MLSSWAADNITFFDAAGKKEYFSVQSAPQRPKREA